MRNTKISRTIGMAAVAASLWAMPAVADDATEAANMKLVTTAYQALFGDHDLTALQKFYREDYIQHNPMAPTGRDGLQKFLTDTGIDKAPKSTLTYLRTAADDKVKNLRDWGLPLGRRFRALKLWFLIREQGVQGLQARLRRDVENARWLLAQIQAAPEWSVLAPVPLQTLCVRHQPEGLAGDALDAHTQAWCDRINRSGEAYLTPAMLDGRWMVRVSIGALLTERPHVEALWALMQEEAGASAT